MVLGGLNGGLLLVLQQLSEGTSPAVSPRARLPTDPAPSCFGTRAAAGPSGSKPRQLREDSRVRLAAQGIARVVVEEEGSTDGGEPTLLVFHCLNNSRAMHASRPAGDNEEGTQQQEGGAEAEGGAVAEGEVSAGGWGG